MSNGVTTKLLAEVTDAEDHVVLPAVPSQDDRSTDPKVRVTYSTFRIIH